MVQPQQRQRAGHDETNQLPGIRPLHPRLVKLARKPHQHPRSEDRPDAPTQALKPRKFGLLVALEAGNVDPVCGHVLRCP